MQNFRSHFHCIHDMQYHLVLVTKYRKKCIKEPMLKDLENICRKTLESWDCQLKEFGGESDHVHLLFQAHPSLKTCDLVANLKTVSSRLIRKKHAQYLAQFYWKPFFWTRSYCILSTGGAPIEIIRQYIQNQSQNSSAQ